MPTNANEENIHARIHAKIRTELSATKTNLAAKEVFCNVFLMQTCGLPKHNQNKLNLCRDFQPNSQDKKI